MKIKFFTGRRNFLKNAAIFGGLAALFGIIRPSALRLKEAQQQQPEPSGQGYRLTEHVKKYYEKARL